MKYNARRGFTLIEVLIAIAIFAIIISIVFGSFNAVVSTNKAINHGVDVYEMARICLSRMSTDLETIYVEQRPKYNKPDFDDPPDPYRFVGDISYEGTNSFSRVRFASSSHLCLNNKEENGIAEIIYYIKESKDDDQLYVLKRADTNYPYEDPDPLDDKQADPILCDSVEKLSFTYYDAEGNENESWDSESDNYKYATPRRMDIKLTLKKVSESYNFRTSVFLPVFRDEVE